MTKAKRALPYIFWGLVVAFSIYAAVYTLMHPGINIWEIK